MLNVLSANRKSLSQWSALRIMRVEPSTGYCTRLGWRLIEKRCKGSTKKAAKQNLTALRQ